MRKRTHEVVIRVVFDKKITTGQALAGVRTFFVGQDQYGILEIDGFEYVKIGRGVRVAPPRPTKSAWNYDMSAAPRDGKLLQLLISHEGDESWNGFDDNDPSRTMGFNNFDNDGEDIWKFPGWSWTHDFITEQSNGKPIAWAFMLDLPDD